MDELEQIVQRMIDAGESEENIAAVIREYQPEEKSVGGFLGNILPSAGRFISDTVSGLPAAAKLAGEVVSLPSRAIGNLMPWGAGAQATVDEARKLAGIGAGAAGAVKDRYGSLEAAGNTLYNDPVGVLGDVATVAGGAGLAARAGGLGKIAKAANAVEGVTNPVRLAAKPVTAGLRAVGPKVQELGVSGYERMLKPNKSTVEGMPRFGGKLEERSRNIARELIADPHGQISKTGANTFSDDTAAIQQKVDDLVAQNPEARGSTQHLVDAMDSGRGKFETQWAPGGDTHAYDAVAKEVLDNPRITKIKRGVRDMSVEHELGMVPQPFPVEAVGRERIPRVRAQTARKLTQGTYRTLGDKAYGELKGASTEAHKAAARGGREILNEAIPAVEPLNNQIAKRIDLGQVLDEAVFRSGKHDPIGLGQTVALSGNMNLIPLTLLNRPVVGSPIARSLFRAGGAAANAGDPALLAQAALLARMLGSENEP